MGLGCSSLLQGADLVLTSLASLKPTSFHSVYLAINYNRSIGLVSLSKSQAA